MTTTITQTRVRVQVQEYDGRYRVIVEHGGRADGWTVVATFDDACCPEHALNQAREAGWAWLVDQ